METDATRHRLKAGLHIPGGKALQALLGSCPQTDSRSTWLISFLGSDEGSRDQSRRQASLHASTAWDMQYCLSSACSGQCMQWFPHSHTLRHCPAFQDQEGDSRDQKMERSPEHWEMIGAEHAQRTHTHTHTRPGARPGGHGVGTDGDAERGSVRGGAPAGARGALTCGDESGASPARSIAGGDPYAPALAPLGCCPGPRAPPSPGTLGLRAPGGHFIAAGSARPPARPPAAPPGPTAPARLVLGSARRRPKAGSAREGGRGQGGGGRGAGSGEGAAGSTRGGRGSGANEARGRSLFDPAGAESLRWRRMRRCRRCCASASRPAPTRSPPPPRPRPEPAPAPAGPELLMVGTNLASRGGGARREAGEGTPPGIGITS
ncbi:hypothetical protein AAY473_000533 [Plecturocebus cupreus]